MSFHGEVCPHVSLEKVPENKLIVTLVSVAPMSGDGLSSSARRIVVTDTGKSGQPSASRTYFLFRRFPSLLHVWWKDGTFDLQREKLPLLLSDKLDQGLMRTGIFRIH